MRKITKFAVYSLFTFLCLNLDVSLDVSLDNEKADPLVILEAGFSQAKADRYNRGQTRRVSRRVARRTAKRVNRRHDYYHQLPTGCTQVIVGHVAHFFCGGIYYQPQLDNNKTIYVIVNP